MTPVAWRPIKGCSPISTGCAHCKAVKAPGGDVLRFDAVSLALPFASQPSEFLVCPHGDVFHAEVPDEWINGVFSTIEACPQHAFQLLTKRAARMHTYVSQRYDERPAPDGLWLGVSAERQKEADERIPFLQRSPVSHRYVTLFPLLGAIALQPFLANGEISAVLAGAEAERPAKPEWFNEIEVACLAAAVPFTVCGSIA